MAMSNITTTAPEFPRQVVDILGEEGAKAFEQWINQKLSVTTRSQRQVEIPAKIARQKVNVLLLDHVGSLLLAGEPQLIESESGGWVWRVPVDLTYASHGRVGRIGEIDVDAYYGTIDYTDQMLTEIKTKAKQLVREVQKKIDNH